MEGNAALELNTSDDEWEMLLQRFGSDDETPDEISFANMMQIFGDMKPVEGFLEEILRRFMKTFVSMTSRVRRLEQHMQTGASKAAAERKRKLAKLVRHWRYESVAAAFDGWRDLTRSNKALKMRSARHFRNALVASAWRRWVEMRAEAAEQRAAVARAAGRWSNRFTSAAFVAWLDVVRTRREQRVAAASRLANRLLSGAFNAWAELAERNGRVQQLQRKALNRMGMALVAMCYERWADAVADTVERRKALLVRTAGSWPFLSSPAFSVSLLRAHASLSCVRACVPRLASTDESTLPTATTFPRHGAAFPLLARFWRAASLPSSRILFIPAPWSLRAGRRRQPPPPARPDAHLRGVARPGAARFGGARVAVRRRRTAADEPPGVHHLRPVVQPGGPSQGGQAACVLRDA